MATNHVRLAQISPTFARECENDHKRPREFPFFQRSAPAAPDRYTRRANICPSCHTARALGSGECLC